MQVRGSGGATLAPAGGIVELRDLIQAHAFVVPVVEIGTKRDAALLGRFNERKGTDAERFCKVMKQIVGKRLTFDELTGKVESSSSGMRPA